MSESCRRLSSRLTTVGASISFYFDSAERPTSAERLFAIREAGTRLHRLRARALASLVEEDWTLRDDFLTIDLAPFVRRTKERMDRLTAARELVVSDPDTLAGALVISGTRIPVYDVAASVAAGLPMARILPAYPSLDADKVELAAIYAEANPAPGRPIERRVSQGFSRRRRSAGSSPRESRVKFLFDECSGS
jgi:uncharacterized protein (DUF433 family)